MAMQRAVLVRATILEGETAALEADLAEQRALWEGRTDRLEQLVTTHQEPS